MANDNESDNNKKGVVLFFRTEDYFSQLHPSKFTVEGIQYSCCEQYMMHQKAVLFKDELMARQILQHMDPTTIKTSGRQVKNCVEEIWIEECRDIVFKGNLAKFSQNEHLKDKLLKTGYRTIAEASPYDKRWGIGLNKNDHRAQNPNEWKGNNWLGEALMKVREELRKTE